MRLQPAHFLLLIFACALLIPWLMQPRVVLAAEMTGSIRTESIATNTSPLPILVEFSPISSANESTLQVTVPQNWTMSGSAGAFTVSSSNLPAGLSALPGISTATQVSGETITFPIADLTAGTSYGFFITGGITKTPTSQSYQEQVWTLQTRQAGSPVDSVSVATPLVANDEIIVSASVLPAATELTTSITASPSGIINQSAIVEYIITYESTYSSSTPLTVVAQWSSESSGNALDIMNYVIGSASQGYGATNPVINTSEKKITWTIPSLPAGAGPQTVSYKLQASTLVLSGSATVTNTAQITAPVTGVASTVEHTYQYNAPTPSPSPTPSPTSTTQEKVHCNQPCSDNSQCNTDYCYLSISRCRAKTNEGDANCSGTSLPVTETQAPLTIQSVRFQNSTARSTNLLVTLSQPATLLVSVVPITGDKTNPLLIHANTASTFHSLDITNLSADTQYLVSIRAQSGDSTITSESFTFRTAKVGTETQLSSFKVVTGATSLLSSSTPPEKRHIFVGGTQILTTLLEFTDQVKWARVTLSPLDQWPASGGYTYSGHDLNKHTNISFSSPPSGTYRLDLEFEDSTNARHTTLLGFVHSVPPLSFRDSGSKAPLDGVLSQFSVQNPVSRLFEIIIPGTLLETNPLFSDARGTISLAVPLGRYSIDASVAGYIPQRVEFLVSQSSENPYPLVELDKSKFFIFSNLQHSSFVVNLYVQRILRVIIEAFHSLRFMQGLWFTAAVSVTAISLATVLHSIGGVLQIPHIFSLIPRLLFAGKNHVQRIRVIDFHTHTGVQASVSILDSQGTVVLEKQTNNRGYVTIPMQKTHSQVLITAKKYIPVELHLVDISDTSVPVVLLERASDIPKHIKTSHILLSAVKEVFEFFLILGVVLALGAVLVGPLLPSALLLLLTLTNVVLWFGYHATHSHIKTEHTTVV